MRKVLLIALFMLMMSDLPTVLGQSDDSSRNRTRESLGALLDKAGPGINVSFRQSTKQPYNYVGVLEHGLVNAESFEIVVSVTPNDTIGFRIYPHYKSAYINADKVQDRAGLMRLLLRLTDRAFLFWGVDEFGDIFTGYTFTLESGFPEDAIRIVLRSIVNSDRFIEEMRPYLDVPIRDITVTRAKAAVTPAAKKRTSKPMRRIRRSRRQ